jgi:hypothetical protein
VIVIEEENVNNCTLLFLSLYIMTLIGTERDINSRPLFQGWVAIEILQPVQLQSNKAEFKVKCTPSTGGAAQTLQAENTTTTATTHEGETTTPPATTDEGEEEGGEGEIESPPATTEGGGG